jgi:hypothetical protein
MHTHTERCVHCGHRTILLGQGFEEGQRLLGHDCCGANVMIISCSERGDDCGSTRMTTSSQADN